MAALLIGVLAGLLPAVGAAWLSPARGPVERVMRIRRRPPTGCLPYGVVGVAGLGDDAVVGVGAQLPELVDDGGFGSAADRASFAPSVIGVPERELAAP